MGNKHIEKGGVSFVLNGKIKVGWSVLDDTIDRAQRECNLVY